MFNREGPVMIITMRDITVRLFEHLDITSIMDLYLSIKYTKFILRGPALNKYWQVLVECKDLERGFMEISVFLGWRKGFLENSSVLGPRWKLSMDRETLSEYRSSAPTLGSIYGLSW